MPHTLSTSTLHTTMRFGEELEAAQKSMLAKNLAKAAAKKAREDAKAAPARLRRIRAQERARYAEKTKAEKLALREQKKSEKEAKRQARERARFIEANLGTFHALGLNTPESQNVFLRIRDTYPAVLISRLAQAGFIAPELVTNAIEHLRSATTTN